MTWNSTLYHDFCEFFFLIKCPHPSQKYVQIPVYASVPLVAHHTMTLVKKKCTFYAEYFHCWGRNVFHTLHHPFHISCQTSGQRRQFHVRFTAAPSLMEKIKPFFSPLPNNRSVANIYVTQASGCAGVMRMWHVLSFFLPFRDCCFSSSLS